MKKYSEREIFIGKQNSKKPRPDYYPQKENVLKPLGLGITNFKNQVSRNQTLLPGLSFPNRDVSPSIYTYADYSLQSKKNRTVDFGKQKCRDNSMYQISDGFNL